MLPTPLYCNKNLNEIDFAKYSFCFIFLVLTLFRPYNVFMAVNLLSWVDFFKRRKPQKDGNLWKFLLGQPADLPNKSGNFFLSLFARHNTNNFWKCQKWAQKNRKPFLDFLFWCAVLCNGGYSIFSLLSATTLQITLYSAIALFSCTGTYK